MTKKAAETETFPRLLAFCKAGSFARSVSFYQNKGAFTGRSGVGDCYFPGGVVEWDGK